jgi:hypothetical protein
MAGAGTMRGKLELAFYKRSFWFQRLLTESASRESSKSAVEMTILVPVQCMDKSLLQALSKVESLDSEKVREKGFSLILDKFQIYLR